MNLHLLAATAIIAFVSCQSRVDPFEGRALACTHDVAREAAQKLATGKDRVAVETWLAEFGIDYWGRSYSWTIDEIGREFSLRSSGKDSVFDTDDDIEVAFGWGKK